LSGIVSLMQNHFDNNKYEDFTRVLFGSKAYLLFYIEKLLTQTTKSLLAIANEEQASQTFSFYD